MGKKKILYAAIKYPYADPSRGLSYEYYNFYLTLQAMSGVIVKEFDWVLLRNQYGKEKMNQMILQDVEQFKPDLVFFSIVWNEFEKETIKKISQKSLTFNWFFDDIGRFDTYIKEWVFCFDWAATVSRDSINRYKAVGYHHILGGDMAVNQLEYRKLSVKKTIDVSFVGQIYGNRKRMLKAIERLDIPIVSYGKGTKNSIVSFDDMIHIFNTSKINLNFTQISFNFPLYYRILPWFLQTADRNSNTRCINGRIFEVMACGGFLLTEYAPHLDRYFKEDKEIVIFKDIEDMVKKIKYFLQNDSKREKIAIAGHKRVLADHTYKKRFTEIFQKIGLL